MTITTAGHGLRKGHTVRINGTDHAVDEVSGTAFTLAKPSMYRRFLNFLRRVSAYVWGPR